MKPLMTRLWYLISRAISKPERAFSAVDNAHPVLDVAIVGILSATWIGALAALCGVRDRSSSISAHVELALAGFGLAMLVITLYGISTSIVAMLFSDRARMISTVLSFVVSGSIGFAVAAVPVTIIRIVDLGAEMSKISDTIVTMGPWAYVIGLLYLATLKIHKTVPGRAIAFLGLGGLPVLIIHMLFTYSFGNLPFGLMY